MSETKSVSKGLADRFSAEFTDKGGQVVYTKTVPDGTTDFTTVASEIAVAGPEPDLLRPASTRSRPH